jgi:2-succinyl-5-enolpyruvyl-6-hydroxy-3-cyclohexene-1-carboxylate synthase
VITDSDTRFITSLTESAESPAPPCGTDGYGSLWAEASRKIPPPRVRFSDLYAVSKLMEVIPENSALHLANSLSVRLAQLCPPGENRLRVLCNRGTNGIDGCLSTAIGYAAVCREETVFLIIGDLAFFYDMNSLSIRQVSHKLRILLNNNGGGEIFHTLPGLHRSEALDTYISATHSRSARAWAESMDFTYLSASCEREFLERLPAFTGKSPRPVLMEVFTSGEENARIINAYYHSLKTE